MRTEPTPPSRCRSCQGMKLMIGVVTNIVPNSWGKTQLCMCCKVQWFPSTQSNGDEFAKHWQMMWVRSGGRTDRMRLQFAIVAISSQLGSEFGCCPPISKYHLVGYIWYLMYPIISQYPRISWAVVPVVPPNPKFHGIFHEINHPAPSSCFPPSPSIPPLTDLIVNRHVIKAPGRAILRMGPPVIIHVRSLDHLSRALP